MHGLMDEAGVPNGKRANLIDDFGWEAKLIPLGSRNVLIVGCGGGMELLFLRAMLPDREVDGSGLWGFADARTEEGDGGALLSWGLERDTLLLRARIRSCFLKPHAGASVFSGPDACYAFLSVAGRWGPDFNAADGCHGRFALSGQSRGDCEEAERSDPIDVVYLDAGHPWKTNPADLRATLLSAGFAKVEMYQQAEHLSRFIAAPQDKFHRRKNVGLKLHALFFGVPRAIARTLLR